MRPVDLRLRMSLHNALEARSASNSDRDVFQRLSIYPRRSEVRGIGREIVGFQYSRLDTSWVVVG